MKNRTYMNALADLRPDLLAELNKRREALDVIMMGQEVAAGSALFTAWSKLDALLWMMIPRPDYRHDADVWLP